MNRVNPKLNKVSQLKIGDKIVLPKIKSLLDQGVQPVFELETEDGKKIRTTGNHPYLVKSLSLPSVYFSSKLNVSNIEGFPLTEELYSQFSNSKSMGGGRQVDQRFSKFQGIGSREKIINFLSNLGSQFGRKFFQILPSSSGKPIFHKEDTLPDLISWRASLYSRLISSLYFLPNGQFASSPSTISPAGFESYNLSGSTSNSFSSIRHINSQKANVSNRNQAGLPFLSSLTTALHFLGKEICFGANLEKCFTSGSRTVKDFDLDDFFTIQPDNNKDKNSLSRNTKWIKVFKLKVGDEIAVATVKSQKSNLKSQNYNKIKIQKSKWKMTKQNLK